MEKCKFNCPLKVIEDYKHLEKELAEDFSRMIKDWLEEHSYVESVYIRDEYGVVCRSMFLSSPKIYCCVTLRKN